MSLYHRYDDSDTHLFLNMASYMDPRFKDYVSRDQSLNSNIKRYTMELSGSSDAEPDAEQDMESDCVSANLAGNGETDTDNKLENMSAMLDFFGENPPAAAEYARHDQSNAAALHARELQLEIDLYHHEPVIKLDSSPLEWWKQHFYHFPKLSQLARAVLSIQATSVAAERVFSTAGDIVSKKRAALTDEHVDSLLFLNKNYRSEFP